MISQSLYFDLVDGLFWAGRESVMEVTEEMESFIKPCVLAIHQPSGRGFYLDRQERHIVDVKDCQEPKNPVKVVRHRLPESGDLPAWVLEELDATDDFGCYDFFWLSDKLATPIDRGV